MVLYLIALLALILIGAKYHIKDSCPDYISVKHTQCIKGIFILLVLATHFVRYNSFPGVYHDLYFKFRRYMNQLIVVPFLFFSGYGVTESIRKKGARYLQAFPYSRILSTYLQFFVATVFYFILRYWQGNNYSYKQIILSFTGYHSLGNGSWYAFAILFLYLLTWLSFTVFFKRESIAICSITVGSLAYILLMRQHTGPYFYNTIISYAAGCWFSHWKPYYERCILQSKKRYFAACVLCIILFLISRDHRKILAIYEICSVMFALLIVLLSSTIQLRNPFLQYCGNHVFSLYILHHIPMILLQHTPLGRHWLVHLLSSMVLVFLFSWAFDRYIVPVINSFCRLIQNFLCPSKKYH